MRAIVRKPAVVCAWLAMLGIFGCHAGTKVLVRQNLYAPSFGMENLSAYRGKSVFLSAVTNNAANTTLWSYYGPQAETAEDWRSASQRYRYETHEVSYEAWPSLQTYFWDCFIKDFHRIGVKMARDASEAPDMRIILSSITDEEFQFEVTLSRSGGPAFRKSFTVTMPPAQTRDLEQLEKRAYRLVDGAFTAIVTDPGFRRAFLGP